MTTTKITPAQLIKAELKKNFPWVKFSCKYKSYTWGSSVDINWKGWPLRAEVEKIARQFEAGYFDGQDDCYYYTSERPYEETTSYVFCERESDDQETEQWIEKMGYTKENLIDGVKSFVDTYDIRHSIASRVMCHLNSGDSDNDKEIGFIVADYIIHLIVR